MARRSNRQNQRARSIISDAYERRDRKKPAPWKYKRSTRILSMICAVILLVVGVLCTGGGIYVGVMLGLIHYDNGMTNYDNLPMLEGDVDDGSVDKVIENPTPVNIDSIEVRGNTDTITNVMLIGVDGRTAEGYSARSDTNMILSVNTETETIKLASLLRDTWVTVPGLDWDGDGEDDYSKLNSAFYYGGFEMLSDTIENNFKLDINQYIAVDFKAFEKAVDALGGVDIELTQEEAEFIPIESDNPDRFVTWDNPDLEPLGHEAGVYHLNGQQALAYCRIRTLYPMSDFTRQSNQRKVIDQLLEKAKTMNFATLTSVLLSVLPYVQTNMSQEELLTYAANALQYTDYEIESDYGVPAEGSNCESAWIGDSLGIWINDMEQTTLELHQYLYNEFADDTDSSEEVVDTEEPDDSYTDDTYTDDTY